MTVTSIHAVGFCAHYSEQGEWAFRRALELARGRNLQLNIFHFLCDPWDKDGFMADRLQDEQRRRKMIEGEKKLRLYYDEMLGDYLNVGFRLCEDNGWKELHRCICNREFQVLFLPYPDREAEFAGRPLTEFAAALACPAALVGPARPDEVYLNAPAAFLSEQLQMDDARWLPLDAGRRIRENACTVVAHPAHERLDYQ
ncbi:MAG: hypothetical protein P8Z49_05070 [Acidobacteriota bacterium]